ncbi:hypothetical protein FB45DRAFT_870764 [Roridomyces roridus]|uniref:Uncharacterized protein n=1 Tax=Roridomyces roridus TaxID=1738132 RepID=A0AAD7BHM9_9AGAR|nr:hypothetical protein FB45DRAFT_870764 [Roridomyces roridus]
MDEPRESWLDDDWDEEDSSSDYSPSDSDSSDSDSDWSDDYLSDNEIADLDTYTFEWYRRRWPTPYQAAQEQRDDLPRKIVQLVQAEQAASARFNPISLVSLITEFLELLIEMGHYPEGSLRYAPHSDPPVNVGLAKQLGYTDVAISLMEQLPYLNLDVNRDNDGCILDRTRFADYTFDEDIRQGRLPYPYDCFPSCTPFDPWMLPLMFAGRDGWLVILDTKLGVVRAYDWQGPRDAECVEWLRNGPRAAPDTDADATEYRRAPLVSADKYFSDLIEAYRTLARLPIIEPNHNDPWDISYASSSPWWATDIGPQQNTLLALYRECGWPDQWRRTEFMQKWELARERILREARAVRSG